MWQRFSNGARKAVFAAQAEARKSGGDFVSTEHLFLGMMEEREDICVQLLVRLKVDTNEACKAVRATLEDGAENVDQDVTLTPRCKHVIDLAYDECRFLSHTQIGTEHLLLGLVRDGDNLSARVLQKLGVQIDDLRALVGGLEYRERSKTEGLSTQRTKSEMSSWREVIGIRPQKFAADFLGILLLVDPNLNVADCLNDFEITPETLVDAMEEEMGKLSSESRKTLPEISDLFDSPEEARRIFVRLALNSNSLAHRAFNALGVDSQKIESYFSN